MEMRDINGNKVMVGMDEMVMGATENTEKVAMNNQNDNGIIKVSEDGNKVIVFANVAQAISSIILAGFSNGQLKYIIPQTRNFASGIVKKMITNNCGRKVRKQFIDALDGNMPRQLDIDEMVAVIEYAGEPKHNLGVPVQKIMDEIRNDMNNSDLIVPVKTRVIKETNPENLSKRVEASKRSLAKFIDRVDKLSTKLSDTRASFAENPDSREIKYKVAKLENDIDRLNLEIEKSKARIARYEEVLAEVSDKFVTATSE